jgi:hypothetical protein
VHLATLSKDLFTHGSLQKLLEKDEKVAFGWLVDPR